MIFWSDVLCLYSALLHVYTHVYTSKNQFCLSTLQYDTLCLCTQCTEQYILQRINFVLKNLTDLILYIYIEMITLITLKLSF